MPRFEKAQPGDEVLDIASQLIDAHYPELHECRKRAEGRTPLSIDFIFVFADPDEDGKPYKPALKLHGAPAYAIIKPVGLKDRSVGHGDVEVRIDGDQWNGYEAKEGLHEGRPPMDGGKRVALIDHELYHLVVKRDAEDEIVRDHLGRCLFRLRPHDWQFGWFDAIAARHGVHSFEVQQATAIVKRAGQLYFDFAENADLRKAIETETTRQFSVV